MFSIVKFRAAVAHPKAFYRERCRHLARSSSEVARVLHYRCRSKRVEPSNLALPAVPIRQKNIFWTALSHASGKQLAKTLRRQLLDKEMGEEMTYADGYCRYSTPNDYVVPAVSSSISTNPKLQTLNRVD